MSVLPSQPHGVGGRVVGTPLGAKMKARYAYLLTILLPAFTVGCFSYVPVDIESVPVGTRVRAHLSSTGAEAFGSRTGVDRETVNGTLVEKRNSSLLFQVRSVSRAQSGASLDDLFQQVDVQRQDIVQIERKKLHTEKTALTIAGGIVGAGVFLYYSLRGEPGTYTPPPDVGPVDNIRVPFQMFRLFLPH